MAAEDHPKYREWSRAQARLNLATEAYNNAEKNNRPEAEIKLAKKAMEDAQAAYDKVDYSDERPTGPLGK
jgi:predicted lipid-binding transport protein (Tim44 family)